MTQEGFKRKLTAILSADVAGYSRLMAEDETPSMAVTTEAGLRIVLFYKYGSTDRLYLDLIVPYFCTERGCSTMLSLRPFRSC